MRPDKPTPREVAQDVIVDCRRMLVDAGLTPEQRVEILNTEIEAARLLSKED